MLFTTLMMIPSSSNSSTPSQPFFLQHGHRKGFACYEKDSDIPEWERLKENPFIPKALSLFYAVVRPTKTAFHLNAKIKIPLIPSLTNICQTCGDKGDLKRLIYCAQCQVSAEHSYCIRKLHKEDDGTVSWKCEECSVNDAKCGSTALRRSTRINEATEAKYNRVKIETGSQEEALKNQEEADLGELCKAECCDENQDLPMKRRRLLDFKEENLIHEECDRYVDTETIHKPYPESSNYSQAEPVSSPAWRGRLRINKAIVVGVGAHASTKACPKVLRAVVGLPPVVDVRLLSRLEVWPPSFERSPPTNENIGVYIFPQCESDEKVLDGAMRDVIERDLALRAVITRNVELLIFSSRVFPTQDWRMCGKFYLWGVFRQKGNQ